ncbi:phasin family protein [Ramlibacter tataouinensis]|uniref:Phasin domain-containing protein n=1 Tax=Ramlibacter tataouinensis TaxID=94132 RepID=A0A127JY64_9BURK|nr:phasin family protein [Ramlibacter tataouinensis]AMO24948.1 hypothetical protein UC35_21580 [Ramlibacter tataouinensis]
MTAKASRADSARLMTEMPFTTFSFFTEMPRRQLALMAQSASALFRGSQEVRQIQQDAAQRASEHYEEAMHRLRGDCDYNDLLAVQAELIRFNMQEASQYWQQLATAGMKLQAEMVSSARDVALEGGDPTLESLQRVFAATLNGSGTAAFTH